MVLRTEHLSVEGCRLAVSTFVRGAKALQELVGGGKHPNYRPSVSFRHHEQNQEFIVCLRLRLMVCTLYMIKLACWTAWKSPRSGPATSLSEVVVQKPLQVKGSILGSMLCCYGKSRQDWPQGLCLWEDWPQCLFLKKCAGPRAIFGLLADALHWNHVHFFNRSGSRLSVSLDVWNSESARTCHLCWHSPGWLCRAAPVLIPGLTIYTFAVCEVLSRKERQPPWRFHSTNWTAGRTKRFQWIPYFYDPGPVLFLS